MSNTTVPDGLKVRLLHPKDQHGRTNLALVSSHGLPGDVVMLSYAVAKDLIRSGEAEEVTNV